MSGRSKDEQDQQREPEQKQLLQMGKGRQFVVKVCIPFNPNHAAGGANDTLFHQLANSPTATILNWRRPTLHDIQ